MKSDSSIFPEFNRTFNWDVKAQSGKVFQVDFLGSGMRQILSSETCPDQQTYTIVIYQRSGPVTIGTFCKDGLIRSVRWLYKGRVTLKLPGPAPLDLSAFNITVGPDIKGGWRSFRYLCGSYSVLYCGQGWAEVKNLPRITHGQLITYAKQI